jgi:hypothetical protein
MARSVSHIPSPGNGTDEGGKVLPGLKDLEQGDWVWSTGK